MELKDFKASIEKLGYKFETNRLSLEVTSDSSKGYCTDCILQIDNGVSAFHYKDARRDNNFKKLQLLRRDEEVYYRNLRVFV